MRCYLVKGTKSKMYAGSQAQARTTRDAIAENDGIKKKDVSIDDAEIPTAKAELIGFVNDLCAEISN